MDRQTLTIGAALLAVVVVGLGILFFLSGDDSGEAPVTATGAGGEARSAIAEIQQARARTETEQPAAPQPRLIERPETAADDSAAGGAGAVTPAPAAPQPTGAAADPALDEAYQEAKAFLADGKIDDGQVMLFFLASRQGHPQAAFDLASMYDPLLSDSSPLDEPDAFQAYKNYGIAAAGGITEANTRLDVLHDWAEQAAADGNAEAERVLLQWEQ